MLADPLGVTEEKFSQDIHAQKGFTCASCHGGDATSDDPEIAMSRKAGFKGKISRAQVPQLCGSCHSDPAVMRKYNPSLRTDQLSQYHTSVHGKRLAAATAKSPFASIATVHDIRPPSDPRSTVNPVNVACTCARCHADEARMKEYKIPTNQFAEYKKSVHHEALTVSGDLSAPTCSRAMETMAPRRLELRRWPMFAPRAMCFRRNCLMPARTRRRLLQPAALPGCVTCHSNHGITIPATR